MKQLFIFILSAISFLSFGQTNIKVTNSKADNIIKNNYNPADYHSGKLENDHKEIICGLQHRISTDSLKSYLEQLESFYTRHTYSDTNSNTTGIGAARRWALQKFEDISAANNNRLVPSYLSFDYPSGSCGAGVDFRNVLAVLPGTETANNQVLIIEAHMDSRCEVPCDINCFAPGVDDNGSGTALVIELARVLSRYSLKHTVVFMLTIGEEEGLYGAEAMANYCKSNDVPLKAVLNNDIIGGIECGETASPPGCPYEGHLDSTNVRLFTEGSISNPNRGFARTIKLYNDEILQGIMDVPMDVEIMNQEDRTGRGGDHIPFRIEGYSNVRFTSANEHGDAAPDQDYTDRQHTSGDVLGVDLNADNKYDKYYVNFEYLKRNTIINGTSLVMLALGPNELSTTVDFEILDEPSGLKLEIKNNLYSEYRIGVRNSNQVNQFDGLYRTSETSFVIPNLDAGSNYFISVAGIDNKGITGPFSSELFRSNDASTAPADQDNLPYGINCNLVSISQMDAVDWAFSLYPNPSEGSFTLAMKKFEEATLNIRGVQGNLVWNSQIKKGENKIGLEATEGVYFYEVTTKTNQRFTGKFVVIKK